MLKIAGTFRANPSGSVYMFVLHVSALQIPPKQPKIPDLAKKYVCVFVLQIKKCDQTLRM